LFLITLPWKANPRDIFRFLCHTAIRVELYKVQNSLKQCCNCQKFGHVYATASKLPVICGVGRPHAQDKSDRRSGTHLEHQDVPIAKWWKERKFIPPITGAADKQKRRCEEEAPKSTQDYIGKDVLF
jgi:hypothetical protein